MKLGIMQPYLFPYLGYFSLIKHTDKWIVFDTVQYIDKGWMNRNRIIHPTKPEPNYFIIPLAKHPRNTIIKDIRISTTEKYIDKITGQLTEAYKKRKAPYFNEVMELVSGCLEKERTSLAMLNTYSLSQVCEYLDIPFDYEIFSEMKLEIEEVTDAGEWALNISKAMHATHYINPPGGIDLFDKEKFVKAGINLEFLKINLTPYTQKKPLFMEGLSIIDVMMFNSPERINEMLNDYTIITK